MRVCWVEVLIVRRCPVCNQILDRRNWDPLVRCVCQQCVGGFQAAGAVSVAGVDVALAVWQYDEEVAPMIGMVKSVGGASAMKRLAPVLGARVRPYRRVSTVVTWIPPSPRGRRRRGFDQGRVLATSVAAQLELPVRPAFSRSGRAQFGGTRSIRLEGPRLRLRPDWHAESDQVIVVDDVITTGTSLATAATLLRTSRPALDIVAAALAVRL